MKILVFLYEENLDDKFNEYILVGNYLQSEIELFSNKKIKIPLKKNIDNKELEKRYDFCEKSYQDILKKIAVSLNNLHNKNFSERFWEIVLGKWLRQFIYVVYYNYLDIKEVLKDNKIEKIKIIDPNRYKLFTQDTNSQFFSKKDKVWMAALNSKIISLLNVKAKIEYVKNEKNSFDIKEFYFPVKNKNYILLVLEKVLSFFTKKNKFIFFLSGFPFFFEKMLEIKLGCHPSFYSKKNFSFFGYDENLRKKIKLSKKENNFLDNEFLNILIYLLPEALPAYIIEYFSVLETLSKKIYSNHNPEKIITSYGYAYDEVFKYFVAKKCENGSKYIVIQHGNNYFTDIHCKHLSELKSTDKFISWGKKDLSKNIISGFNFKTIRKIKIKKDAKYLSALTHPIYFPCSPYDRDYFNEIDFFDFSDLLFKFKNTIKKKVRVKFHDDILRNDSYHYYKNLFNNKGLELYKKELKPKKIFENSRLFLFSYDSTGILENLAMNIPTIFYLKKTSMRVMENYDYKYKILKEAGIYFDDKDELIKHINLVWENINDWWLNNKTQEKIKLFNSKFNISYKNFDEVLNIFEKID